jgi:hypothetical protein
MNTGQFHTTAAARARADAPEIVRRMLTTSDTAAMVAADYGCCDRTIWLIYRGNTTKEQRRAACAAKISVARTGKGMGRKPWNDGVKGIHLSPETEFKPGERRARAERMNVPVGTIVTRQPVGGKPQRWIKVSDRGPRPRRWMTYARRVWEDSFGPVQAGYCVRHRNGDTLDDAPANLVLRLGWRRSVSSRDRARQNVLAFVRGLEAA